ncbi:MAG: efflux RND transporter periplasmic adaptor subunit [Halioglobus sp.]|nr:efflux RND transporter periplasmic adaptor subunit [Halioglobus sp.]
MVRKIPGYSLLLTALWCCCGPAVVCAQNGSPVPVTVVAAQEQGIRRVLNLTGTVTAVRAAQLSAATSGLVSAVHVDAGSSVHQGQVLLELDAELAQLQLQSARAQREQAANALQDARRRLAEARVLVPQRSIAESAVRDIEAEVAIDEAVLHQAQADADYLQGVLERHQVKAPFDGVVSAKLTESGEWVVPGQAVLALVALDAVRLDFAVAEDFLADIKPGAPLTFRLNAAPERAYPGRVSTVVPVTDPQDRTFLLRVLADNPDQRLLPGMSVRASLKLDTGRHALTVPRDAILRFPDGRMVVWTVEDGEGGAVAHENPVRIGLAFDAVVEIREGLRAGATVVVAGNETLQDGQRVAPRQSAAGG